MAVVVKSVAPTPPVGAEVAAEVMPRGIDGRVESEFRGAVSPDFEAKVLRKKIDATCREVTLAWYLLYHDTAVCAADARRAP